MKWTDEIDRRLFLFVLASQQIKVDNDAAAAYLSKLGEPCTAEAVRQHLNILKRKLNTDSSDLAATSPTTATPTTPTSRGRAKKGTKVGVPNENGGDEDEETPVKKRKTTPKAKAQGEIGGKRGGKSGVKGEKTVAMKVEDGEENGGDGGEDGHAANGYGGVGNASGNVKDEPVDDED